MTTLTIDLPDNIAWEARDAGLLTPDVVVSALIWGGTPFKLLQAAIDGNITLYK